jgi:Peptidase family M28
MDPSDLVRRLAAVQRRGAGTDAERRAARLLAAELRGLGRRGVRTVPLWVRPAWGVVHALVLVLAAAGSVIAVSAPVAGLALAGAALLLWAGDLSGRAPLLRRLTPARATQDVVSRDRREDLPVRLVLSAPVDVPRAGLLDRGPAARAQAALRRALRGRGPGRHGLATLALAGILACAAVRVAGAGGPVLAPIQLVPTILALLLAGAFLDAALAPPAPSGANANASAAAVLLAAVAELDRRPPSHLAVDVLLAGAGEAHALGARRWIARARRDGVRPEQVVVLHLAPCGAGRPVFWVRDGLVLALRYHPRLVALARRLAADERHLGLRAHETRGTSAARAARAVGWPALALGCVDAAGAVPRAGTRGDTPERVDPAALQAALEACLALVAALDADLRAGAGRPPVVPAAPAR